MKDVTLRMAWRNLWRHWRRTWLTVGAMIFSNGLLIFAMSLQFGSYDMMIDNSLQAYSGHLQLQHPRYLEDPKMRYAVDDVSELAEHLRRELGLESVSARATGFALASSNERSYGLQIIGVDPAHEPLVSTLPGLVKQGRYLDPGRPGEIVIGAVLARNLKIELRFRRFVCRRHRHGGRHIRIRHRRPGSCAGAGRSRLFPGRICDAKPRSQSDRARAAHR